MKLELDLRMEASAMSEMAENTRDDPGFRVPSVDWGRSARQVLTTELDRRHADRRCRGLAAPRAST